MQVLVLNTKEGNSANLNGYMILGLAEGLRDWLGDESVTITGYRDVVRTAEKLHPDALICYDGENVQADILLEVRKLGIPVACWFTEDPYELAYNVGNQHLFDKIFTNEKSAVGAYSAGEAQFLPLAAPKSLCYFQVNPSPRYDVCIAGSAWPERVQFSRDLMKLLPDLRMKIILSKIPGVPEPGLEIPEIDWNIRFSIRDICGIFNDSRIVVTLKRQYSHRKIGYGVSPAPRLFETAIAGTAQLVQVTNGDQIEDYFAPREEVDVFWSIEECAQKIQLLVNNPRRRLELAERAQARALTEHLFKNRARIILDWIEQKYSKPINSMAPKRLLICVHGSTSSGGFGGTEIWAEDLAEFLKNRWQVFRLYPRESWGRTVWRLEDVNNNLTEDIQIESIDPTCSASMGHALKFKQILLKHNIQLVHFQHLLTGFTLSTPQLAGELGIPYTLAVTDYYPVCHKFTLLNQYGTYCHPDQISMNDCDICLRLSHGFGPGSQAARRMIFAGILKEASAVVCVSDFTRDLLLQIYPEAETNVKVVQPTAPAWTGAPPNPANKVLSVVIPSYFSRYKGADAVMETIFHYRMNQEISFNILGKIDPECQPHLERMMGPNVQLLGGYKPKDRLQVFEDSDLALFLSIWPEGYPLTCEELRRMAVPTIVTDMGQLGRIVEDGVTGWKVHPNDAGAVIEIIDSILEDRTKLLNVRRNLQRMKLRDYGQDFHEFEAIFEGALQNRRTRMQDRSITNSQLGWLSEELTSKPKHQTVWANMSTDLMHPGASLGQIRQRQQTSQERPQLASSRIPTPREAYALIAYYVKHEGLLRTLRLILQWLRS